MHHIEVFPAGNLFPIVKKYLINYSTPPTEYVLPVIPGGNVHLMYTHAESASLAYKHHTEKVSTCLGVGGQIWQEQIKGICSGHVEYLFTELHPVALYYLYKTPVKVFIDRFTPLEGVAELQQVEKIRNTCDIYSNLASFRNFLETHLPVHEILSDNIYCLTQLIEQRAGYMSVDEMAQYLGLSIRQLQRIFLEKMGIPPKYYSKILQMRQVTNLVMKKSSFSLTEVAYEYGHYDASHFYKDFKRFLNMNPKQFIQENTPLLNELIKEELKQSFC